ncbi:paired amphipathic helix protein Sin3-like 5 [Andrographis paniculata]|uniref:paired amphipathic helix protein Sin3-like 5 n=1 Tax=Andrographis paniculata TaxID=175694 RepID=UPI0021E6F75A|nr:paired amphipathic helix protein Sin3-like 5 [Andrographis paniculata]
MKRSRDDGFVGSQHKRPAVSPPPPVEPSLPMAAQISTASSMPKLTTTDALTYLKSVKEIFQDKKDKYDEFLDVMKDFKAQRLDTYGVIAKVKELFKGNRDLILGFNAFLPKGYEITLPPEDEFLKKKPVEFDEAINFVNKIKARFQGHDHIYKSFLEILNMYRRDNKSISEVYQEVEVLFREHHDLLVEFTHFLPDGSDTTFVEFQPASRNTARLGNDRSSPMTSARPMHVEKKLAVPYANHHNSDKLNHVEKVTEKREVADRYEKEHADNADHKRKFANQDESGADRFQRGTPDPESAFLEKVKERIKDRENLEKIYDCIRSYKSKFFSASQFRNLLAGLFGTHQDLFAACEDFITYIEKIGSSRSNKHVTRSSKLEVDGIEHDRANRDRHRDSENGERYRHDKGLNFNGRDSVAQKMSPYASREKFPMKPIQELDLTNCESCTPSYRLLPENYPIPQASCRTEIGAQVLNDRWVSVTSGSEDYSFKHMRKNQYEESLFRCEDDRFELDMLLEAVKSTAKRIEELSITMTSHADGAEGSFCLEDHLTALHQRVIERLYGDHGLDMLDIVKKNAPGSLPVLLFRLKQKQQQWESCRAQFNKVWSEIYAKNYHKSLDHRSFYFKQQDERNLSAKALLAEIKEISEKNQNEDEIALSISAGYRQPIRPHMEFEYPDPDIHKDLYQIMKYSCGKLCTPEEHGKFMKIWTNFLHPFFGISSHPSNAEDKNGPSEANNCVAESLESKENGSPADKGARKKSPDTAENGDLAAKNNDVGVNDDFTPGAENIDTSQNVPNPTDTVTMSAGEKSASDENASAARKGSNSDCGLKAITTQESQPEASKSAVKNLEDPKSAEDNNTVMKEEMCIAVEETDANAADDGDESANSFSGAENGSVNGDVSASESVNEEECEPDEDDENDKMAESEGEADGLLSAKPISLKFSTLSNGSDKNYRVFYGNKSFYSLFRLHQILYERMRSAKLHSLSPENKWKFLNNANLDEPYERFKVALNKLLQGAFDNTRFEDECRAIVGAQSYVLFTLDKLIRKLVEQLNKIADGDMENKLVQLYAYENSRNPKTSSDAVYYKNARLHLPEDDLYRIECSDVPIHVTVQLMRNEPDKLEPISVCMDHDVAAYLNGEPPVPARTKKPGVFLKRNRDKFSTGDENSDACEALEGLIIRNGVEMKVNTNTKKVAYVLDTEDFLYRGRTKACDGDARRKKQKRTFSDELLKLLESLAKTRFAVVREAQ